MIRQRLKSELKQIQDEELKEKILNRLIDSHPFTPPSSMIERQTRYLMERNATSAASDVGQAEPAPTTEETRRLMEARSIRQVQATLILERVSQLEKIEVADNQLQERVDQIARAAGERGKSVREVYSRPEAQEELRAQMTFERTLDFLLARAVIKEVDASAFKVDDAAENG
jgi:trigger factor